MTVDELAGLFSGRTRFVERLAQEDDPLGRARDVARELSEDEKVELTIAIADPHDHYHVPLLVSSYQCTTYRGS